MNSLFNHIVHKFLHFMCIAKQFTARAIIIYVKAHNISNTINILLRRTLNDILLTKLRAASTQKMPMRVLSRLDTEINKIIYTKEKKIHIFQQLRARFWCIYASFPLGTFKYKFFISIFEMCSQTIFQPL